MIRIVSAALSIVVMLSGSASAECAWVLWMEKPAGSNQWRISPSPTVGFDTRQQCQETATFFNDANRSGGQPLTEVFRCLPDNVDPRVPKGK
jgi:hypothetical protein